VTVCLGPFHASYLPKKGDMERRSGPDWRQYRVWDAPTRIFHWVNFVCVLGILAAGVLILYSREIGVDRPSEILLKHVHVWLGYVLIFNLAWRFVWAFMGNRYARWTAIVPGGSGFLKSARAYGAAFVTGTPQQYLGHNPLGRVAIAAMFVLLVIMSLTGLVLAGTDLYHPPFGRWIAEWIAAPGVDPATLNPLSREGIDPAAYAEMRAFRSPFITVHLYAFWCLAALIVLHVAAVIITEIHEGGDLISAMISGRKMLSKPPVDEPERE
jgi:cytochrome b